MSVLIKSLDKPDHCLRCPVKGIDDECLLQSEAANADYESWEDQMANCPLVPIPEHGRLVDADELHSALRKRAKEFSNSEYGEGVKCGLADAREYIKIATTIIPSEQPEEE